MNQVRCFNCGNICVKNGKTKAGTQRWLCKECSATFTNPIDNSTKQFVQFQHWLFSKAVQKEMSGAGRSFRRKISNLHAQIEGSRIKVSGRIRERCHQSNRFFTLFHDSAFLLSYKAFLSPFRMTGNGKASS